MSITEQVLLVDDEVKILDSLRRQFHKKFKIKTASSGDVALHLIKKEKFAVIVSDMNMPGMNGVELLEQVKELRPNIVRVMLTGNADTVTPVEAINKGDVFRFHNKPCHLDVLEKTINDALKQHQLIMAEKELLEGTLTGSIQILTELLSIINPEAFGRTSQIKQYTLDIGRSLGIKKLWQLEVMASLSLIGCILLPSEATKKLSLGQVLNEEEQALFNMHPKTGADLINKIPRMKTIANGILYQEKLFDGTGLPNDDVKGKDIPVGARILKVVMDYDRLLSSGRSPDLAMECMKGQAHHYDPDILNAFFNCLGNEDFEQQTISVRSLQEGMLITENLYTKTGRLVLCKGQELTPTLCNQLFKLLDNEAITDRITIKIKDAAKSA